MSAVLCEKLDVMVRDPPRDAGYVVHRSIAWPQDVLFWDADHTRLAGYSMTYLEPTIFHPLNTYYSTSERTRLFGGHFTWKYLYHVAFNLASTVAALHEQHYCIGDLRESNILASPTTLITLIDADSFQVRDPDTGKVYYCRVGRMEYLPPEVLAMDFRTADVDRHYSDLFALGVCLFRILMNGYHPFASRGPLVSDAPATVDKIRKGLFAYDRAIDYVEPPPQAPLYESVVPPDARVLFHRCFVDGYRNKELRPSAAEWVNVLRSVVHHG